MKDFCTFLPAFAGVILVCCEASSFGIQILCALSGFALWGIAWIVWQAFEAAERRRRHLRRRRKKEARPVERQLRRSA